MQNGLNMTWQEQAAVNFKDLYQSALEFQSVDQIAVRLDHAYANVHDYNEAVRTCPDLEPAAKIWLVIPSY